MEMISNHINYFEATNSPTATAKGIKNEPNIDQLKAMRLVAVKCFEPLRLWANVPLSINSFFRGEALNKAIGGAASSQHCKGEAIDIDMKGDKVTNAILFHWIKDNLKFDQLLWEHGTKENPDWVHVSYSDKNRNQVLRAKKVNGKTIYEKF